MTDSMAVLVWKSNRYGIKGNNKLWGIAISMLPRAYTEMILTFQQTHLNEDDGS